MVRMMRRIVGHHVLLATASYGAHVELLALVLAIVAAIHIDIRSRSGGRLFIRMRRSINHRPSVLGRCGMVGCLLHLLRIVLIPRFHLTNVIHNDLLDNGWIVVVLPMISIQFPIRMTVVLNVKTLDATCKHLLGSY